jgi:ABC-type glycerol-3-phosphate transport system substrate-binding protein
MMDTVHAHKVAPSPQALQGQPPLFVAGRVAIEQQGSARLALMVDGLKENLAVLPTPSGPAGNFPYMASACWNVLSTTKLKDQSWELAKFVGLTQGQEIVLKMGIPAKRQLAHGPFVQQYPNLNLKPVLENYEKHGTYYVFTPDADEWWNAASQALEPMWSGEKRVPDAMRAAQDAVNQVFARRPAEWND